MSSDIAQLQSESDPAEQVSLIPNTPHRRRSDPIIEGKAEEIDCNMFTNQKFKQQYS